MGDGNAAVRRGRPLSPDDLGIVLHPVRHRAGLQREGWTDATPGDFLYVPQGGIHAFRNESGKRASFLLLFTPGAPREGYFETLAEIASGRQFTSEDWRELYQRHDQYMVDI